MRHGDFNGMFLQPRSMSAEQERSIQWQRQSGHVAASTIVANDGFINIGAGQLFNSAITTNTANTGTLTLNGAAA